MAAFLAAEKLISDVYIPHENHFGVD